MNMTKSQLRVVVNTDEQNLGCVVKSLREAPIANRLDIGNIWSSDELLQFGKIVSLGQSVNKFSVNKVLLHSLAGHLQVWN